MQLLGFNFEKITANKEKEFSRKSEINTNIEFTEMEEQDSKLISTKKVIKVSFLFEVKYKNKEKKKKNIEANLEFQGNLILSAEKKESKEIIKHWKNKEVPNSFKIPLFNVILQRCNVKALQLEDDLNIPPHVPFPKIAPKPKQEQD